jgi:hypothetical protein
MTPISQFKRWAAVNPTIEKIRDTVDYSVTNFSIAWYHAANIVEDKGDHYVLWCPGVTIDATINIKKFQPHKNTTYQVGFVQILNYSNQKALYKKPGHTPVVTRRFKIVSWEQQHLPVFDGNHLGLYYDASSCKTITGTGQYNVELKDYPTLRVNKTDDTANNHYNLTRALKYNKFHVLLIVRRSDANDIQHGIWCDYLRNVEWKTKVEASFDPNQNSAVLQTHHDEASSILPLQHVTVWDPARRNWGMDNVHAANNDQRFEYYKDVLGILEFKDFTVDRYTPVIAI